MKLLLKVISFPVRLKLFLTFGIISAAISGLAMTAGVLLVLAVRLIASAGTLFTVLFSAAAVIEICCLFFQPEKYTFSDNSPIKILILLGILYAACFLLFLLPTAAEKILALFLSAAAGIWSFAKLILFCR